MAEIENLHPVLSTDVSVIALKIGHQNLSFSIDFIGLRHYSSTIFHVTKIISILEKICPNILKRLLIFNLFMTHQTRKSQ